MRLHNESFPLLRSRRGTNEEIFFLLSVDPIPGLRLIVPEDIFLLVEMERFVPLGDEVFGVQLHTVVGVLEKRKIS